VRLRIEVIDTRMFESTVRVVEGETVRIGSAPTCDCPIPAPAVAPEHVILTVNEGRWHARDTGSPGGTCLAAGDGWKPLQGSAAIDLPARLRVGPHHVLKIDVTTAPASGPGPQAGGPSLVESIGSNELEEGILVLDMCGSSSMASADEKMAYHLKKRMREIVYPLLVSNGAQYTESTGDGWMATFPAAARTVAVALEIMAVLRERNQNSRNPPINVRIALHFGKTYVIDAAHRNRHGSDLNLGFRVEGVQEGSFTSVSAPLPRENRILCTRELRDRYRSETGKDDLRLTCCGTASLKGIPRSVEIFLISPE
jgi:class 3 adenylate cyclase